MAEPPSLVQVKFSGDGANFNKSGNYLLLSFSFPSICKDVLAGKGNHTFAVVPCSEDYTSLKQNFAPVFSEMNEIIEEKEIIVNDEKIMLDIVFGGDMKFVLIVLGLNAAHANYACIWCEIHKKQR